MHRQRTKSEEERDLIGSDLLGEIERDPERERIEAEEKAAAIERERIAKEAEAARIKQERLDEERRRAAEKQRLKAQRLIAETLDIISKLRPIEKNINSKLTRNGKIKDDISFYERSGRRPEIHVG